MSVVHGTVAGRNLSTLKKYLMVVTNLYLLCKRKKDDCKNRMLVKIASALPLFAMGNFPRKNTNKSVPVERLKTCL